MRLINSLNAAVGSDNDDVMKDSVYFSILKNTILDMETTIIGICKTQNWRSGSTALVVIVVNNVHVYVCNVGDSQVVINQGDAVTPIMQPHSPARDDERIRITNAGGSVVNYDGVWRVHPGQVIFIFLTILCLLL